MSDEKIIINLLTMNSSSFGLYVGERLDSLNITKTKFSSLIFKDIRNVRLLCNGYRKNISIEERLEILNKLEELEKAKN